jgi:hypothetical protein
MRRRPFALALVGWTFLVWTTRIANIWRDEGLDTAGKVGRTGLALSFTVLAIAVLVALWRSSARSTRLAVGALAAWTAGVWVVRGTAILLGDHGAGFKAVHAILAVVSIVLAAGAWREDGAVGRADGPSAISSARRPAPASGSGNPRRP